MERQPKYRRHSTRDLGFVEHAGKRKYFSGPYDSDESRGQYFTFLRSLGFLVYETGRKPECAITIAILTDRFDLWARANYPPGNRSRAGNLRSVIKLLLEFAALEPAVKFTPLRMKAFQQWLVTQELGRRYINDVCANVRFIFKWGVSEELIPLATFQSLATVAGLKAGRTSAPESKPREPVPNKVVAATLRKLNKTVRAMVEFQRLTGVRSQSICTARVCQFDCSKKLWEWKPKHKTQHLGHDLTVFVGPRAQKIIAPYLRGKQPSDYVFQPRNKLGKRSRLYRAFYDPDTYRRAVQRAAVKAGVGPWFPHLLRHTRGTEVREKHGLEAAQASLGHRRIDATQIYAKAQREKARMVAKTMG